MERLFAVAFALLVAVQVAITVMTFGLVVVFIGLMWERAPWRAVAAVAVLGAVMVGLWRAWRQERPVPGRDGVHPGPSISRIPLSGSMGAIYMLQFVVWALLIPGVGLFYLALVVGGALLIPVVNYVNRRARRRAGHVAAGTVVVAVGAMLGVSAASSREMPGAWLFGLAVVAGCVAAVGLVLWRRGQTHPTIAPYVK